MRLTIDADPAELHAALFGEAPAQETATEPEPEAPKREPLPLWVVVFVSSAATLCVVLGIAALVKGISG